MTQLDDSLRPVAVDLIAQFGKAAVIRRVDQGTFNPATGKYSGGSTTNHNVTVSPPEAFAQERIDGDLIRQDDFSVSLAAKDVPVVPNTGTETTKDTVILEGSEYQIVRVEPVHSGEEVALYRVQCRK